jgi:hypothetical protein
VNFREGSVDPIQEAFFGEVFVDFLLGESAKLEPLEVIRVFLLGGDLERLESDVSPG